MIASARPEAPHPSGDEPDRGPDLLGVVAALGLPDAPAPPAAPLPAERWAHLLDQVVHQRLVGLLDAATHTGAWPVTADQRRQIAREAERQAADVLALESLVVRLAAHLDGRGVEWRLLKGAAIARRFYPRPELRGFGDLDVLVRARDFDRVAADLLELGCVRRYAEPRPGFTASFGKGACFVTPHNFEIDLHRTFASGPFGLSFDPGALFDSAGSVEVGQQSLPTLGDVLQAVHAAAHAVLGSPSPRRSTLRDLVQILRDPAVAPDAVIEQAEALGLTLPLALAVRAVREHLGVGTVATMDAWADEQQPSPRDARMLAAYDSVDARYARQVLSGLAVLRGVRPRLRYVWALAVPSRPYLRARDGALTARWSRALRIWRRSETRG